MKKLHAVVGALQIVPMRRSYSVVPCRPTRRAARRFVRPDELQERFLAEAAEPLLERLCALA